MKPYPAEGDGLIGLLTGALTLSYASKRSFQRRKDLTEPGDLETAPPDRAGLPGIGFSISGGRAGPWAG